MGEDEPEPGLLERLAEWGAEHPLLVAIAFGLPLTLGPVAAYAAWQIWRGDDEDGAAEDEAGVEVLEA